MGPSVPLSVLFVVPYAPSRIRTRPYHLIRALAALGHRVTVGTLWDDDGERRVVDGLAGDGHAIIAEPLSRTRRIANCIQALPRREPLQAHYSWNPRLMRRLIRTVEACPVDVIHVEHLRGVRYGLGLAGHVAHRGPRRPAVIWDSVDCISALWRRTATEGATRRARLIARFELRRTEHFEGACGRRFDRVLLTSPLDREQLLGLDHASWQGGRPAAVEVLPNGVDLDYFAPVDEPRQAMTLVITGKMSYHANATAVARFVDDVMPVVLAQRPHVRLWVVGKDPTPELVTLGHRNPQVSVTGTVEDVRPYLRAATLAVAPILYGAGIQNKVLEALACGTPVVASPAAVSAIRSRTGDGVRVAATPVELAAAIVDLLDDPARCARMGHAGRRFVERHHDWRTAAARLVTIYHDARGEVQSTRWAS